jgi:hypothetical protein
LSSTAVGLCRLKCFVIKHRFSRNFHAFRIRRYQFAEALGAIDSVGE